MVQYIFMTAMVAVCFVKYIFFMLVIHKHTVMGHLEF